MPATDRYKQAKIDFDTHGYAVVRGFFNTQQMQELLAEYDRYVAEVLDTVGPMDVFFEEKDKPQTLQRISNLNRYDDYFKQLLHSDRWSNLAALLLDDIVTPQGVGMFNKPPVIGKPTPPHQDGYYWMLEPCVGLSYWMALDPVDQSNGCLRFVPGSHDGPYRSHKRGTTFGFSQEITDFGDADRAIEEAVELQPGDLVVHHGKTIHRADANTSERMRRGLVTVFWGSRAKEDTARKAAYHKQLQEELAADGKI